MVILSKPARVTIFNQLTLHQHQQMEDNMNRYFPTYIQCLHWVTYPCVAGAIVDATWNFSWQKIWPVVSLNRNSVVQLTLDRRLKHSHITVYCHYLLMYSLHHRSYINFLFYPLARSTQRNLFLLEVLFVT